MRASPGAAIPARSNFGSKARMPSGSRRSSTLHAERGILIVSVKFSFRSIVVFSRNAYDQIAPVVEPRHGQLEVGSLRRELQAIVARYCHDGAIALPRHTVPSHCKVVKTVLAERVAASGPIRHFDDPAPRHLTVLSGPLESKAAGDPHDAHSAWKRGCALAMRRVFPAVELTIRLLAGRDRVVLFGNGDGKDVGQEIGSATRRWRAKRRCDLRDGVLHVA